jgi:16S rRNA (cytidine1402-2'-O)-methyltransferase
MLYVVPTPIGNLEDMTLRAIRVLRDVDLIACEDTRRAATLLGHYEVATPRISYHTHNERSRIIQIISRLKEGADVALISDAGTPGVSDPGFALVREAIREELDVTVLPGPSAVLPALVGSGLPCERFVFEGFLPTRKGRRTRIDALVGEARTMVFFESPHRIVRTLGDLAEAFGADRPAAIAREVSKMFEEYSRGTLRELHDLMERRDKIKGELVLTVGGASRDRRPR